MEKIQQGRMGLDRGDDYDERFHRLLKLRDKGDKIVRESDNVLNKKHLQF